MFAFLLVALQLGTSGCTTALPSASTDSQRRFRPTTSAVSIPGGHSSLEFLQSELNRVGCISRLGTEREAEYELHSITVGSDAFMTGKSAALLLPTMLTLTAYFGIPFTSTATGEAWATVLHNDEEIGIVNSKEVFEFTWNVWTLEKRHDAAELVVRKRAASTLAAEIAELICESI